MTDLHQALSDIRTLRRQVATSTEFRGYGPATLFATALLAVAAGCSQTVFVDDPMAHPVQYVGLWMATAVVCAALIATQMIARSNRLHSGVADEMIRAAVLQFLPAGVAGALLPFVLLRSAPAVLWMLPGLWQLIFALGVFASCRSLPRPMLVVGVWFLLTGFASVMLGDARALAPARMAGAFAVGMAMVAVIHLLAARKAKFHGDEEL